MPPTSIRRPRCRMRDEASAMASAPMTAPMPMDDVSAPYPVAPRCKTSRANTGIMAI